LPVGFGVQIIYQLLGLPQAYWYHNQSL